MSLKGQFIATLNQGEEYSHVDSQPARENAKQLNERKIKLRSCQKQVCLYIMLVTSCYIVCKQLYECRPNLCRKKEVYFWLQNDEK